MYIYRLDLVSVLRRDNIGPFDTLKIKEIEESFTILRRSFIFNAH